MSNNNKMTKCKVCGKDVAKGAKRCPSCGHDQRSFFGKHKIITVILIFFVLGAIGSAFGGDTEDSSSTSSTTSTTRSTEQTTEPEEDVPTEYKSALKKAEIYSGTMAMSKKAIYDQLVSEYGEKFSEEAAQYAIDNLKADYKENALKKAKTYQDDMAMSPDAIYDQLISDYGEQFTEEEAQYAIDNLE